MRPAIAMIELIFALVIMGIVLMSAPELISTSSKSAYASMQQETIVTTASHIRTIMSASWDEQDANSSIGSPVLQTAYTSCTTDTPPGTTSATGRYCKDALATNSNIYYASTTLHPEGTELFGIYNDIDDYNAQGKALSDINETTTTPEGDYIDIHTTITAKVVYADNNLSDGVTIAYSNPFDATATGKTTDVKLISVDTNSSGSAEELKDKHIRLSAFMCNIGAPKEIISNEGSL